MFLFLVALGAAFALRKVAPSAHRVRPRIRWIALPIIAAGLQAGLGLPFDRHLGSDPHFAVIVVSYAVVGVWLLVNTVSQTRPLRLPAAIITGGWLCNLVAIIANRGMPVSRWALAEIGARHPSVSNGNLFKHVFSGPHTVVPWLGDAIPVAVPVLRNVVSVGDIVIFVGVMVAVRLVDFSSKKPSVESAPIVRSEISLQTSHTR